MGTSACFLIGSCQSHVPFSKVHWRVQLVLVMSRGFSWLSKRFDGFLHFDIWAEASCADLVPGPRAQVTINLVNMEDHLQLVLSVQRVWKLRGS